MACAVSASSSALDNRARLTRHRARDAPSGLIRGGGDAHELENPVGVSGLQLQLLTQFTQLMPAVATDGFEHGVARRLDRLVALKDGALDERGHDLGEILLLRFEA